SDGLPLGGVTIVASNGAEEITTISLTTGDLGGFALRNLPTPATYTITFSADGYATENLSLNVEAAQQLTGLEVELARGTGSISGLVRLDGGEQDLPLGGITVTVAGADVSVVTESLSVGAVGTYLITGLPLPGTYTVTFSGAGYATQVRSVDLDARSSSNETGVDATMTASTATVSGTVSDPDGPASGVSVVLTDGTVTLATTSADDPVGEYALPGVPPGTYTLTFSRIGAVPKSVLVTVGAGESEVVDIELEPQATISGTVHRLTDGDETPLSGAQVLVYTVAGFPGEVAGSAITDEDGEYVITDLAAPLEYIVEFAFPEGALAQVSERVTLDAGESVDDVDATLVLAGDDDEEDES
ncbi:MAG TPA: carboxypeptidase regulatory-like domain-containing protein, partial [Acidimicrobiales bacterium]|nr:carboxypeptidase regulatory-like domain-containing protein [Acidimicrobiales bacterium]